MKTKLCLFSFFIYGILCAQTISGKIISKEDNQPIAFAKIQIENESYKAFSDKNGNYSIDLTNVDKTKNIQIQLSGFVDFIQKTEDFINSENYTIFLNKKVINLNEVVIDNSVKYIDKNWGTNTHSPLAIISYNSKFKDEYKGREFAIFFNNHKKVKIEKIHMNIYILKIDEPLELCFNFYSKNGEFPDKPLFPDGFTTTLSADDIKNKTFTLDISDKNIVINKEDFFVTIKRLNDPEGYIFFNGAFFKPFYHRNNDSEWKKTPVASPVLNIDLKVIKTKNSKPDTENLPDTESIES